MSSDGGPDVPEFELSGYLELEADFNDDYVNLESGSAGDMESLPWADMDYAVVHVDDGSDDGIYTTIVGPFDDYDDFYDAYLDWYEEGS